MKTHFLEWCTPGYGIHGVVGPTKVVVGSGVRRVARVARVVKVVGVVTVVATLFGHILTLDAVHFPDLNVHELAGIQPDAVIVH